jgi:hypothetical protein
MPVASLEHMTTLLAGIGSSTCNPAGPAPPVATASPVLVAVALVAVSAPAPSSANSLSAAPSRCCCCEARSEGAVAGEGAVRAVPASTASTSSDAEVGGTSPRSSASSSRRSFLPSAPW